MGTTALTISSPAFADGDVIPDEFTCRGADTNPPLTFSGIPDGTASLALIMHDPDAPSGDFLHWSLWNINPNLGSLPAGAVPDGALTGLNSFGKTTYGGPCPPSGTHHYIFMLFALDTELNLPQGSNKSELLQSIDDHTIAQAVLTGLYSSR